MHNRNLLALGTTLMVSTLVSPSLGAGLDDPIPGVIPKGPLRVELQLVAGGLTSPNVLTSARDGTDRLFIAEQDGFIRLIKNNALLPTPYLDVSTLLVPLGVFGTQNENDFDERGLIGLAFHPGFEDAGSVGHGKFYTYTSEPVNGAADFSTSIPVDRTFDHQSVIREWILGQRGQVNGNEIGQSLRSSTVIQLVQSNRQRHRRHHSQPVRRRVRGTAR
ncbi:MAG: hypothetical protein IIB57_03455 [Planctomycetes bacterium]|nr:hypothetical protein [Planctomycetota bacterium]